MSSVQYSSYAVQKETVGTAVLTVIDPAAEVSVVKFILVDGNGVESAELAYDRFSLTGNEGVYEKDIALHASNQTRIRPIVHLNGGATEFPEELVFGAAGAGTSMAFPNGLDIGAYGRIRVADATSTNDNARWLFRNGNDTHGALRLIANDANAFSLDAVQANNSAINKTLVIQPNGGATRLGGSLMAASAGVGKAGSPAANNPTYVLNTTNDATPHATIEGFDGTTTRRFLDCDFANSNVSMPQPFHSVAVFSTYTGDGVWSTNARPSYVAAPNGGERKILFGYHDNGTGQYIPSIGFSAEISTPFNSGLILQSRYQNVQGGAADTSNRWQVSFDGTVSWGIGTAVPDVTLRRAASGALQIEAASSAQLRFSHTSGGSDVGVVYQNAGILRLGKSGASDWLQITLSNGASGFYGPYIDFNATGLGAPTFATRSAGARLIVWPSSIGASDAGHSIGVESGAMWCGVGTTSNAHKWYAGTTEWMRLNSSGLTLTGLPGVTLEMNAGAAGLFAANRAGNSRWRFGADGAAEGGSNSGNNFGVFAYADAGTFQFTVIQGARTGNNPLSIRVGGALKNVTEGAANSGGTGFKQLIVPN